MISSIPDRVGTLPELAAACGNEDLIAYGTGKVGKLVIPHLIQNTDLRLHGVTNSHITEDDAGTFLDTGLPVRSLRAWYRQFPEAMILVTTSRPDFHIEIAQICKEIGFHKMVCITQPLERDVLFSQVNNLIPAKNRAILDLFIQYVNYYLVDRMCMANEIRDIQMEAFSEFRSCHKNQSIAVVGAGPTLNYYSQLDIPHIGVNNVFLKPGIRLDYYFARDYAMKLPWYNELKNYDFIKFFSVAEWSSEGREIYQIPETLIEENHGRRFVVQLEKEYIHFDIAHYPLMGLGSVIFGAIHFALYTMPKQIYLIGCDCSVEGHYDGSIGGPNVSDTTAFIENWKWIKGFVTRYYPGIEIVSVNPVGLKGMFHDVYTESYLNAHPELNRDACEILDTGY